MIGYFKLALSSKGKYMQEKKSRVKDITGKRFGKLTAVALISSTKEYINEKYGPRYVVIWRFVCDCGNFIDKKKNNITSGIGLSCKACQWKPTKGYKNKDKIISETYSFIEFNGEISHLEKLE